MRPPPALLALVRFELARRWAGRRLRAALVLVAAGSALLGWGIEAGHLLLGDVVRLYGYLYLTSLTLVYRFDLAHDMDRGFCDLLAPNLVSAGVLTAARLGAGVAGVLQFAVPAALLTAVAPSLDLRFAVWCGTLWGLGALLAAPLVLATEFWLRTRLPLSALALLTLILLLAGSSAGAVEGTATALGLRWLGFGSFASLGPLATRALLAGGLGLVAAGVAAARHRTPH